MLTGGPGQDTIFADATSASCGWYSYTCKIPFGNDVVNARDGEADTIDCGVGEDRAVVDAIDIVTNCETVDKAGATTGPGAPAGDRSRRHGGPAFTAKRSARRADGDDPVRRRLQGLGDADGQGQEARHARKTLLKAGNAKLTLKFKKPKKNVTATLKVTLEAADGTKTTSSKSVKLKR